MFVLQEQSMTEQKTKRRYDVGWDAAKSKAEELAWERTGFKGPDHVKESARSLPIEEKLEILAEIFADEIARRHFERRVEFQEKLGKNMVVGAQEMIDWLYHTFKGDDEVEWRIETTWVQDSRISPDFQLIDPRSYPSKKNGRR